MSGISFQFVLIRAFESFHIQYVAALQQRHGAVSACRQGQICVIYGPDILCTDFACKKLRIFHSIIRSTTIFSLLRRYLMKFMSSSFVIESSPL